MCFGHSKDPGVALDLELITNRMWIWATLDHGRARIAMLDRFSNIDQNVLIVIRSLDIQELLFLRAFCRGSAPLGCCVVPLGEEPFMQLGTCQ